MTEPSGTIDLTMAELREVTAFAIAGARPSLAIFERDRPGDARPALAIASATEFAQGASRTKVLRDHAWAAHRAAQEARDDDQPAAMNAARAAAHTCGAAFLHPLAQADQVEHILASAAYTTLALDHDMAGDAVVAETFLDEAVAFATPTVRSVLARYPSPSPSPSLGGGRLGDLIRRLDALLR